MLDLVFQNHAITLHVEGLIGLAALIVVSVVSAVVILRRGRADDLDI